MDRDLLERVKEALRESEIDAWLVSSSETVTDPHLSWLLGEPLPFRNLLFVPAEGDPFVVLSSLDAPLVEMEKRVFSKRGDLKGILSSLPYSSVALDFSQHGIDGLTHTDFLFLEKHLSADLLPADFLVSVRSVKTRAQLKSHRKACKKTLSALAELPSLLSPGATELSIRDALDALLGDPAFPTIVASGPNTASPHHTPSPRKLREGEPLLVDLGARVDCCCADITRTFFIGDPPKKVDDLYLKVRSALELLVSKARPGAKTSEIAEAVPFEMVHLAAHSIGLQPHDVGLSFTKDSDDVLEEGNVLAVEPALYADIGIRIEDDLHVSKSPELMSDAPQKLPRLKL